MGRVAGLRGISFLASVCIGAAILLTACSGPKQSNAGNVPAGNGTAQVVAAAREFQPGILTIPVGTTVTWINHGGDAHTVTSSDGLFFGSLGPIHGSYSFTFNQTGRFEYHCDIHDYAVMAGVVVVQ